MRNWRAAAACLDTDPEVFFPAAEPDFNPETGAHERAYIAQAAPALAICRTCPVQPDCLADALTRDTKKDLWAIQGGTLPGQRHLMRHSRRAAQAAAAKTRVPAATV